MISIRVFECEVTPGQVALSCARGEGISLDERPISAGQGRVNQKTKCSKIITLQWQKSGKISILLPALTAIAPSQRTSKIAKLQLFAAIVSDFLRILGEQAEIVPPRLSDLRVVTGK